MTENHICSFLCLSSSGLDFESYPSSTVIHLLQQKNTSKFTFCYGIQTLYRNLLCVCCPVMRSFSETLATIYLEP
eukprot:m.54960 g.54960  ORF g.54960 m.54960 type:complete len:75 (+) comp34431_c0_seq3:244-468(+)